MTSVVFWALNDNKIKFLCVSINAVSVHFGLISAARGKKIEGLDFNLVISYNRIALNENSLIRSMFIILGIDNRLTNGLIFLKETENEHLL